LDVHIRGRLDLLWERWYDTSLLGSPATALGPGWTTRYFATLTRTADGYRLVTPEGGFESFPDPDDTVERGGVIRLVGSYLELAKIEHRLVVTRWDVETGKIERYVFLPGRNGDAWPLASIEDATGQGLDLSCDNQGRVTAVRQRLERRVLVLDYSTGSRITGISLLTPDDRRIPLVRYEYDDAGRLTAAYDALGNADRYEYDSDSRLAREIVKDGGIFSFTYDRRGRCIRTSGLDGYDAKTLRYLDAINWTEVTNSLGDVTRYEWLASGQVTREVDSLGGIRQTEYDEHGRIIARIDPNGAATRYRFDAYGNRCAVTNPLGYDHSLTFDQNHLPLTLTDPAGNVWKREYDSSNRLIATEDPAGGRWLITYDVHGNVTVLTAPNGARKRQTFTDTGILLEATDWVGNPTRYVFDEFGRIGERRESTGAIVRFAYDPVGNLRQITLPNGVRITCSHDSGGNITGVTNGGGHKATFRYGSCQRLLQSTDRSGNTVTYHWGTEPKRLERVINENGDVYTFAYDQAGRVVSEIGFDGRELHFQYDPAGRVVAQTNGNGETITLKRDPVGRLVECILPDGASTAFEYDILGHLVSAVNPDCALKFERDALGRVIREVQGDYFVDSRFDTAGKLTRTITSLGHQADYDVDGNGLLTRITGDSRYVLEFVRNEMGQEVSRLLPGLFKLDQRYDALGRLVEQRLASGRMRLAERAADAKVQAIIQRDYSYDNSGALTRLEDSRWGTVDYVYDPAERLLHALRSLGASEHFTYDAAGNIRTVATDVGDESLTYGPGNRLSRKGRTAYIYDDNGRLVRKIENSDGATPKEWHFTWDGLDQLRAMRTPEGEVWHYAYDAFGRRVSKQGPDTRIGFVWDRNVIIHEIENERLASTWMFDHYTFKPLCTLQNGMFYSVIPDHLGTPRELVDEKGRIAWSASYSSWGEIAEKNPQRVDCPIRFQGQWYDEESGLHYSRFRYYDPTTGRYISQDPLRLLAGLNLYAYARNPTGWIDPFGLADQPGCGSGDDKSDDEQQTVYRGERSSNSPETVFKEGLHSKGDNPDLLHHASANQADSGFIATSTQREIAEGFAGKNGYVYEITTSKGVDVNQTLGPASPFPEQREVAIPRHVPPEDIKGAYPMKGGKPTGEFIPNPNYRGT
jgi:RHS repeat-associated protein